METSDQVEAPTETNRDRVRRLFLDPLARDGMRFRRQVTPEEQRRRLDRLADDLGYMTDEALKVLAISMRTKGEGAERAFWPSRVSILGFAEAFQSRPLVELPGLRSWFVSAAGRAAASVSGRLVAEYAFWTKHKHPPFNDQHMRRVAEHASEIAGRYELLLDRERRDVLTDAADCAWLARYRETEAMLLGWLSERDNAA